MFDPSNYSAKSKYYDDLNKLVVGKIKNETGDVAIEGFLGFKMYSVLVDDSNEQKKAKGLKRNFVARISHNEYKDVLLNKKCLRHSMNRIQIKWYRTRTYEINKISLSCFDYKIHILNNGYDGLPLG